MSAVVVVLKPFSPFTKSDHEIDLNQLPPPPALDEFSPEFHGRPPQHLGECISIPAQLANPLGVPDVRCSKKRCIAALHTCADSGCDFSQTLPLSIPRQSRPVSSQAPPERKPEGNKEHQRGSEAPAKSEKELRRINSAVYWHCKC